VGILCYCILDKLTWIYTGIGGGYRDKLNLPGIVGGNIILSYIRSLYWNFIQTLLGVS